MRQTPPRHRHRAGLAMSLALGLSVGLGFDVFNPTPARAARVASKVKLTPDPSETSDPAWLALLASRVAAARSAASATGGTAAASPAGSTALPPSVPVVPANITDPITNSKFLKDLEKLITLKSGRLVNWNQQELDALASDLGIASPRHVAPHLTTTRPVLEAQTIDGSSGVGGSVPQPAPVPEPGTLLIFTMALGGLIARGRFSRRNAVG